MISGLCVVVLILLIIIIVVISLVMMLFFVLVRGGHHTFVYRLHAAVNHIGNLRCVSLKESKDFLVRRGLDYRDPFFG